MKKWLWGLLFLSSLCIQNAFAIDLVWWWQEVISYTTLQSKINKCESDWWKIDTNFKIVNWKAITTYFCKFDSDNICDLDSYVEGQCYINKKPIIEKKEEDNFWIYKALVLEYREMLYNMPAFEFTKTINWWKWLYADSKFANAIYLMQNVDIRIDSLVEKKPKFKDAFKALKQENSRVRDILSREYITWNINALYLWDIPVWWKIEILGIRKMWDLLYEVYTQYEEIKANFSMKFWATKYEKDWKIYLDVDIKTLARQIEEL